MAEEKQSGEEGGQFAVPSHMVADRITENLQKLARRRLPDGSPGDRLMSELMCDMAVLVLQMYRAQRGPMDSGSTDSERGARGG